MVLVLRGGPSLERDVSLESGRCVAAALRQAGHSVRQADIGPDDLSALDQSDGRHFDVVFPLLHGTFGEDGQLQEILEQRALRFVGSGSAASRLAIDKFRSKKAFEQAGLLTPNAILIETHHGDIQSDRRITESIDQVQLPCVIKPNRQGSSLGVVIARQGDQAVEAVRDSLANYGDCLVEQYIDGSEYTVGIVGDQTLPVLEIRPAEGFYDYTAKYKADDTQYIFDTALTDRQIKAMREAARKAFDVLDCRDMARIDFIVDEQGRIYVLEVNTIPGFTDHSLVPKAAARLGMTMEKLCDHIVQMAHIRPIEEKSGVEKLHRQ